MDNKFQGWLEEHKVYCELIMDRLKFYTFSYQLADAFPEMYKVWQKIDIKKDKSLSAKYFRFWLYLRLVEEHKYNG